MRSSSGLRLIWTHRIPKHMKQYPTEILVAQSSLGFVSLWLHRDHDYPWLEYPRTKPTKCIGLAPLETQALGRLLREIRNTEIGPLTVEVAPLSNDGGASAADDVIVVICSGTVPLVAHVPKISTVEEAHRLLAARPALPALAVGDSLVSRAEWVERWRAAPGRKLTTRTCSAKFLS
jgi:hypothetical protein